MEDKSDQQMLEVSHFNVRQSISILIIRLIVLELVITTIFLFSCGVLICQINPIIHQGSTIIFSIIKLVLVIYLILLWLTEYYEIKSDMIIHRRGIFFIKETRHPFEYIREVDFEQSLLGRLLNYGTISIFNWQTKKFHHLYMIHNPTRYYSIITKLVPNSERYKKFIR